VANPKAQIDLDRRLMFIQIAFSHSLGRVQPTVFDR
jgi:hypothetical protein